MVFPNIKKLLQKVLEIIPLILAIWGLLDKGKDEEEDEKSE